MQFAHKGEYIEWDEDEETFYLNKNMFNKFNEDKLKQVARGLILGL